jgi:hypothetical protein
MLSAMHDDDIPELLSDEDLRSMLARRRRTSKPPGSRMKPRAWTEAALSKHVRRWRVAVFAYEWKGDAGQTAIATRILAYHEERLERWKTERSRAMLGGKQGG